MKERGINVVSNIAQDVAFYGDAQRIRQLLHNLLENSCRYISSNGSLELTLRQSEGQVTITFDDSGPGLSEEHMEHLFERFYRADQSRSRAHGGSGLGLSICQNIVAAHQGSIHAEASPIGGLRICLQLPIKGD